MFSQTITPRRAKLILLILLCLIISGLTGAYYVEKLTSNDNIIEDFKIDSEAALVLNLMKHTSSRNGIREWVLEADSARLLKDEDKVLLKGMKVLFFMENGKTVHATANNGIMNTVTHDIIFSGNVILKYLESTLKTEQLHYEKKSHIIYSTVKITVTNKASTLEAETLKFDLNLNKLLMKGNVIALLSEMSDF